MTDAKSTIEKLLELQALDAEIFEMRKDVDSFPDRMKQWRDHLEKKKVAAASAHKEHTRMRLSRKEKEGQLKALEDEIRRLQKVQNEVKTNREYNSLMKEIEAVRRKISDIEEDLIGLMDRDDELDRREKEIASALAEEERVFAEREESERKRVESLSETLREKERSRQKKVSEIDAHNCQLYDRIRQGKRDGIAICRICGDPGRESCGGCFVFVPTYISEQVRKGEIAQCENCSRILCK